MEPQDLLTGNAWPLITTRVAAGYEAYYAILITEALGFLDMTHVSFGARPFI